MTFTKKQKEAFDLLMSGKNVFLSGEAGTGKSYVINSFLREKNDENILVCAPTGIAAINVGGITIHRAFKAPLETIIEEKVKTVDEAVINADIIIIDEISMCRVDLFDYVAKSIDLAIKKRKEKIKLAKRLNHESCLNFFESEEEWGRWKNKKTADIQFIVVGDFFQLPPVLVPRDKDILDAFYEKNINFAFAFQGTEWQKIKFHSIILDEVIRQKDTEFVKSLNQARTGDKKCIDFFNTKSSKKKIKDGIILTAKNKTAADINQKELSRVFDEEYIFYSEEHGDVKDSDIPTDKCLKLKKGARIMTLINDQGERFQNGSLGCISYIDEDEITLEMDNGNFVELEKYKWTIQDVMVETGNDGKKKLVKKEIGSFRQYPIKLAYAITIHKSQGQTYEKVNIDPYCWASGQLYVALSRVKKLNQMHLINKIKEEYLIASAEVLKFYDDIKKNSKPKKQKSKTQKKKTEKLILKSEKEVLEKESIDFFDNLLAKLDSL